MRKKGLPERNELVVCRISTINPNSVYADLLEYDAKGMIHVSELAKRWVRNAREFVKEQQYVVCKVMAVESQELTLSLKRVFPKDAERQLNRYKREMKAEKIIEFTAKTLNKSMDEAIKEVGEPLLEAFGSLYKALDIAVKDPTLLKDKIPKEWETALVDVAKKRTVVKTYEVKAELLLTSYEPDGVEKIKSALSLAGNDINVNYVSAPKYMLAAKGNNYKDVKRIVEEAAERVTKALKGGDASFRIIDEK